MATLDYEAPPAQLVFQYNEEHMNDSFVDATYEDQGDMAMSHRELSSFESFSFSLRITSYLDLRPMSCVS